MFLSLLFIEKPDPGKQRRKKEGKHRFIETLLYVQDIFTLMSCTECRNSFFVYIHGETEAQRLKNRNG